MRGERRKYRKEKNKKKKKKKKEGEEEKIDGFNRITSRWTVEARTEGKVGGEPRPELVNKDDRELAWARATTRADE